MKKSINRLEEIQAKKEYKHLETVIDQLKHQVESIETFIHESSSFSSMSENKEQGNFIYQYSNLSDFLDELLTANTTHKKK